MSDTPPPPPAGPRPSLLAPDLTRAELEAAPVLASLDALVIPELTEAEVAAFLAALGT